MMKIFFTPYVKRKHLGLFLALIAAFLFTENASAQLGLYTFTGTGACPNQNPAVALQPSNATFSSFTNTGNNCVIASDVFKIQNLNTTGALKLNQYNQFRVTASAGYQVTLSGINFSQSIDETPSGSTSWSLRSNLDNYASDITSGTLTTSLQNYSVALPATFSNLDDIIFRLYIVHANSNITSWTLDDITINGTVNQRPADPGNPTSNSPQCNPPGVTLTATGTPPAGVSWYWQTTATGTSTANSASTNTVFTPGTYYLRAQDNNTLTWSIGAGSTTIAILSSVGTPVFSAGSTSSRCRGAGTGTYTASAANTTGITYSLDAASISQGNTINPSTGAVTYVAAWTGPSTITATAAGCNGPATATHTVSMLPDVTVPVFALGDNSQRCQQGNQITYTATASNASSITYALDAASLAGNNSINSGTGKVTWSNGWSGSSTITVTATGCSGPQTATHTVLTTATVGTPVFTSGSSSVRCQGAGTVTYAATATTTTGITYSLNNAALTAGNSIDATSGQVTYVSGWTGTTIITASAAGCNGPATAQHTVTITPTVGTPIFTLGANSTRCRGAGSNTYTATATNNTGITYSLDATSIGQGNTINAATGAVTFVTGWVGPSTITATAAGCNGPAMSTHTVSMSPDVAVPVFALGDNSQRCQQGNQITYTATASNATTLTYALDAASLAGNNSINATTGKVTWNSGWSGSSTITVTAAGCSGPQTATHTVYTTPTVGTPVFASGSSTVRCQGAGTVTYAATATTTTGITYSLNSAALTAGNSIDAATGQVTYVAGWTGATIITASAAGCNGPLTAQHTVTITPTVGTPIFTLGATSTRCRGAGSNIYTATATNNTGITYSLDATSTGQGNTINPTTGAVTYVVSWTGPSVITATATGCNGPATSSHTVTMRPDIGTPIFAMADSSVRCQQGGIGGAVTYSATSTNSTGITYSIDAASVAGGNSIDNTGKLTYSNTWTGWTDITATASGCNGPVSNTISAYTKPIVGTPVFAGGSTSTRCQGPATITYSATAANNTGLTYSLNSAALTAGNSIDAATGAVTYLSSWSGTAIITATATGCSGPTTATHTVTVTPSVATPVFALGSSTTRCQGASSVTYTATAANNTGITYSIDAASIAGGNSINSSNGILTYAGTWSGTTTITATATGCNGPVLAYHTVAITPSVATPVFVSGSSSSRCQGAGSVTYTANASNTTGLTYSIDAASISGGNSINSTTGQVIYAAGWSGTTTITVSATGCNGPKTAVHTMTTTPNVGTPVFSAGASSTRCQSAGTVNYSATATNNTGISYNLDGASLAAGNTINSSTGDVGFIAGWSGTSVITASAVGCNGPKTSSHTVSITPVVSSPVFNLGSFSSRQQGAATIVYSATALNSTGIIYSLDAASLAGGNSINSTTGAVTYTATWAGNSIITAVATGCGGPSAPSTHLVYNNSTVVGVPLYLSDPLQALDRIDPVATNDNTTASSVILSSSAIGVSVDAHTNGYSPNPGSTSFSVNHTTGNGSNRLMLVGVSQKNKNVMGVTYGGVPLTLVGTQISTNGHVDIYKLVNPPIGTAPVVVSYDVNPDKGTVVGVTTFSGVNQTTPLGTFVSASGHSAASSVTVSSGAGDLVFDVNTVRNIQFASTAGQTELYNIATGSEVYGGSSTKPGASTVSMGWTGATADWVIGAVSIKPAAGTLITTFNQTPALCSDLIVKAGQNISVSNYINVVTGSMPANPVISAQLLYDSTNIITLNNPTYNSGTGIMTWTGQPASDITIPAGKAITYKIATAQPGVSFKVLHDAGTAPSKIILPTSTYISISSINVYNAPYPNGNIIYSALNNSTVYVRAVVSSPFGAADITGFTLNFSPPGSTVNATEVSSSGCTKTYEFSWTTPASAGNYDITATALEGYENSIRQIVNFNVALCTVCPPVAVIDSAHGAGGAPILVDVLANDTDPNNNINRGSLSILTQPNNGTAYLSNGKIAYLPNGSYSGRDTLTYQVCDSTLPAPLCATAQAIITIDPLIFDPCSDATMSHTYFLPFPEQTSWTILDSSSTATMASNNIRTIISIKVPYPGMRIVWDEWEDGYEINPFNPSQSTTKIWGDGNPYNGIAPGYADDILPAGAGIVLDNTMAANPRLTSSIYYDGKDRITCSGQLALTQVSGEPSIIGVQVMKTNVTATSDYGTSFTIPVGQNFNSRDFAYTALLVTAAEDSTMLQIDKDNDGIFETNDTLARGQVKFVDGGVLAGATVYSSRPVGVTVHFGGKDSYSSREVPIFPSSWYSNIYYTPVPTTGRAANPADSAVVMLYNSLNRPITINWSSGIPSNGSITIPGKTTVRFPMAMSQTAAYKFVNPTGESFTAIEIVDSYTPGTGGNSGADFDWSFNLISESRLTDYATIAWAPGSTDGSRNDNPIWVTPSINTTIYVKYNGDVQNGGSISPCGLHYDVSYTLNALNHKRVLDPNDKDQSGIAIYTCNGAKLAAVYGEDPSTAGIANPSWDVGSTIQPFCKQKLIFANDDYARTLVGEPVTIPILLNDFGFLAVVDPTSVSTIGRLQPKHGIVTVNNNGTILYTPDAGYIGNDTLEYTVCSTPVAVCDFATVYIQISSCPSPLNQNIISGKVFLDKNKDGLNNDGGQGFTPSKVFLYMDNNCNGMPEINELKDSVTVDSSGTYQFTSYPEKTVMDNFDGAGGTSTCASGTDGNAAWKSDWTDLGDASIGICNYTKTAAQTDADLFVDQGSYAMRMKDKNISITRTIDLSGSSYAFMNFSYRRKSTSMTTGHNLIVQASSDGVTFGTVYTIAGDGTTDAGYVNIYNQDITQYAAATTYIRFLTNANMTDQDSVYIDNISIKYLKYPQCYITAINTPMIPFPYHLTTQAKNTMVAAAGVTCFGPYDFGIAKNSVSISGTLFNDANGLTDNSINGITLGNISGVPMYAYLLDSLGKVAFRTAINVSTGQYIFPDADVQAKYTVQVSSAVIAFGEDGPGDSYLPNNWVNTGESYGLNNLAGVGIRPGVSTGMISITTGMSNVTNVNFGCERLPDSDDKLVHYSYNLPGVLYDVPQFSGTDPEDGLLSAGKTYRITSLPPGAVLYYNGVSVVLNQVISNFVPSLLKVDPDDMTHSTSFTYASMDLAGQFDPSPATVTMDWQGLVLANTNLTLTGVLKNNSSYLTWKTNSESHSDHFEIERSADALNFMHIGKVAAKGNSAVVSVYNAVDLIPMNGINYYRIKLFNTDHSYIFSNIISLIAEGGEEDMPKVNPNPFTSSIYIDMNLAEAGQVGFHFFDANGRSVYHTEQKGVKGPNKFVISDLDKLPPGTYMLTINTANETFREKLIKTK